ncbi:MAG: FAD-dependent oxidoreductase [Alphaproteobacteria bacterium]|nr:FAD-dependent oxidoreductase [Alphaproteobacteria bacterium]
MPQSPAADDHDTVDVIIVGAGAAGLAAALAAHAQGASVALLEKSGAVGGAAAISGGIVWAPNNARMREAGIADSADDARAYFGSLNHGDIRDDVLGAFVTEAPEALAFLESACPIRFELLPGYPDYYLDRPGAKQSGGRALDSGLFSYKALGEWAGKVASNGQPMPIKLLETPLGGATGAIDPQVIGARIANDERGWGQALVGAMLKGCLDAGITPRLNTAVTQLLRDGARISGVAIKDGDGAASALFARHGVILTTGGFEHDRALTQAFLKGPMTTPASPPHLTGDGLRLAMTAGAALGNMTQSWWMPVLEPGDTWFGGTKRALPVLIERTLPGSIMVNRAGKRFCNEAANYSALSGAFHAFDPNAYAYPNLPAFLIMDGAFRAKYPVASAMPGMPAPFLAEAGTLAELAGRIGVDADGLAATVARFNGFARTGVDEDFHRGAHAYDRFYGDRSRDGAFATLGALETPPFSAVEIKMGTLGTTGGPLTDARARVLGHDGAPIAGLFAAGNCIAAPTGGVYAGAGGTLGPALTFGVIAGRAAAQRANWEN